VDTPLSAARRARFHQTQPGTTVFEVSKACLCAAQRYGPSVTIGPSMPTEPTRETTRKAP
jgi:hypothetical protein